MTKNVKAVLALFLFTLTLITVAGCGRQNSTDPTSQSPRKKMEAVKPNDDDGAIYSSTKEFVQALVADDREKVLSLLTAEHRSSWKEESFLIKNDEKQQFEDVVLDNLNYTVIKYVNNEDTNFENTGMIFAVYDVVMKNNGEEAGRVKLQESLMFRRENGKWLIALDERGFLVEKN